MFYREAGDFKTSYTDDNQTFPIKFDRYRYYFVLFAAFCVIPFIINDYWVNAVFIPFLIYAIAAIGLNILVGYCGQVSLGTGGSITMQFTDNALTGSGDSAADLHIFEIGADVEGFFVEISTDGFAWVDLGLLAGQPTSIDIDASVPICQPSRNDACPPVV